MPQSKEVHREYMMRYRNITHGIVDGVDATVTKKSVAKSVTQYPAIVEAVLDPVKRRKLERVCESLKEHNVSKEVRYGVGGPTFDVVEEIIRIT